MKKKFSLKFKSIYVKFTIIFVCIWWMMNSMTFGVIMYVMSVSRITQFDPNFSEMIYEFKKIRSLTGHIFLVSVLLGTLIILVVVRGIVKPIKELSKASREVAKGNFDVHVETKSIDEVGRLAADFNTMAKELKSIDTLRKDFVSNVSHEFRTPITSIKGFAKLLRDDELTDQQRFEFSDIIVSESERLMDMSNNLLRLSELDSQVIRQETTQFSLDEQIRKTILILEPQWSKKNIEFDIDLERVEYYGEEDLLKQVWLNLINNAIKFSSNDGIIRISLYRQNDTLKMEICDNGIGISDEDKQHIFDRFYKGDKSRSGEGNGLGLVIVKKIVELSGGKIYFESEKGKGTQFTVELKI